MWKNMVERDRPQVTKRRMRIGRCIPNATDAHSEYVILIAFSTAKMVEGTRLNVTLCVQCLSFFFFFAVALRPNAGNSLLILEVSRSHNDDAPQSVGLLWTSDQLVAETST